MEKAKARATKTRGGILVKIGRVTEPTQEISISKGSTVGDVLDELGIELGSSEEMWVNGVKADLVDKPEDGDMIQIAGKKEGAIDPKEGETVTEEKVEEKDEDEDDE